MARSIKKKKKSNRDQLRASVTYSPTKDKGIYRETRINDGDPSTYAPSSGNHSFRAGPGPARPNLIRRTTTRKVTQTEAQRKIREASDKKRKRK